MRYIDFFFFFFEGLQFIIDSNYRSGGLPNQEKYISSSFNSIAIMHSCHGRELLHQYIIRIKLIDHWIFKISDFGLANYYTPNHYLPFRNSVVKDVV